MLCSPFFLDEPSILWIEAGDFFPFHARAQRCTSVALNSFTRFGLLLGVMLSILRVDLRYMIVCLLFPILAVAAFYGMQSRTTLREGFLVAGTDAANRVPADVIGQTDRKKPTADNPFMTALVDEIQRAPNRPPPSSGVGMEPPTMTASDPETKKELDAFFQTSIYGDPGDVFNRNQSQRQFIVPPSTSIPNDANSYQNWLYRIPAKTCKEGNSSACRAGTEAGRFPHLS